MTDLIDKLDKAIIEANGMISADELNDATDMIDDLDFDSINIISLVICLEKEFEIEIPDEFLLLENLRSYAKIKEMLVNQVHLTELISREENI